MAAFWLALASLILISTYLSLPLVAGGTLRAFNSAFSFEMQTQSPSITPHVELYATGVLALGIFAICFACFLIGRTAFVEIELAARFLALADALCLAGSNLEQLEKAANFLLPGTKYLSVPEIFSVKDLDTVATIIKDLRGK